MASYDETVFSATPALEVGNQWATQGGTLVPITYVRGGVSFYNDVDFPIVASYAVTVMFVYLTRRLAQLTYSVRGATAWSAGCRSSHASV